MSVHAVSPLGGDPIPPLLTAGIPAPALQARPCSLADTTRRGGRDTVLPQGVLLGEAPPPAESFLLCSGAVVRGDMSHVALRGHTVIGRGAVVRPPLRWAVGQAQAQCPERVPVGIFTSIGDAVTCEAASVGAFVRIDEGCVIECGAAIPDGVWIQAGSWVTAEAALAPFCVYGGRPAAFLGQRNPAACRAVQMEHVRSLLEANGGDGGGGGPQMSGRKCT